jgi:UDP-N-acetyl-D-glucosamine dehydrogenase
MSAIAAELRQRLESRTAAVGVIGLGNVGLPLAVAFAEAEFSVKAGVSDGRESPALEIIEALARRGARVEYTDPRVPEPTVGGRRLTGVDWAQADLALYDLVVVLTAHPEFDARRVVREARLVLDTRNLTGELGPPPHVVRL